MSNKNLNSFKTKELEISILNEVEKNNKDIIKHNFNDEIVWIKRPRQTNSNIFHKMAYNMTKIKGLMPVEKKSKEQTLIHEVSKIQRLYEKGIKVPEVLGCNNNIFVLEDTGVTIKSYLRNKELNRNIFESKIKETLQLLINMHLKNEYHAGPQVKNYTIKNGIVYAIDFEDSFDSRFSLEDIQFRDFFLFLFSLTELKKDIDYKEIVDIYMRETKKIGIDKELKSIALKLNFLTKIVENRFLHNLFFDDVINTYKLIKTLQKL